MTSVKVGASQLSRLSLRFVMSMALFFVMALANLFFYFYDRHKVHETATEQALARIAQQGAMAQGILEYSYRYRLEKLPQITVVGAGDDENVLMALFVDESSRVLASSRIRLNGLNLSEISSRFLLVERERLEDGIRRARADLSMYVEHLEDPDTLIAFQPVYMLGQSREESQVGILILYYDLANYMLEAEASVRNFFFIYSGFSLLVALFLGLLFYFLVNRRTDDILRGLVLYRKGALKSRIRVKGGDELGQIAASINQLMDQMELARLDLERKANDLELANSSLVESRREAESASRAKTQFVANVSHEVRTPLNAILGLSDILSETRLSAEQKEYVGVIQKAGYGLLNLINDLLDVSKIESGKMSLEIIRFLIDEVAQETLQFFLLRAEGKNVRLVYRRDPRVSGAWFQDPTRVRQILMNLISNALKFTESGSIEVDIQLNDTARPGTHLITVKDTGIGIAPAERQGLFQYFTQANESISRKYGGTGLGLSICKRLSDLMGGNIWVESEPSQGSTFYVTLSVGPVDEQVTNHELGTGLQALLLYANGERREDREWATQSLQALGVSVVERQFGQVTEAEVFNTNLLVVSTQSDEAARQWLLQPEFHRLKGLGDRLRTVLLVSEVDNDSFKLSSTLGGAFIVLPLNNDFYWEKILIDLNRHGKKGEIIADKEATKLVSTTAGGNHEYQPIGRKVGRVLLVDDSDDNRLLIRAFLRAEPLEIVEVANGTDAVTAFRKGTFDLVLMDIQMPGMDGYAATRHIRALEEEEKRTPVPIFALTASAQIEERNKAMSSGCSEFLTKPVSKPVLLDVVRRYLSRRNVT